MSEMVIACVPKALADVLEPGKYPDNVPGSTYIAIPCPQCHQLMWLGARSARKVVDEGLKAICMTCLIKDGRLAHCPVRSLGAG